MIDGLKIYIPKATVVDCYEEPPCISGLQVLEEIQNKNLEYVVLSDQVQLSSALVTGDDNTTTLIIYTGLGFGVW